MSQEADQNSVNSTAAFQWADGLGRVFRHVALFDIRGTVARVAGVHGLSPAVVGRSLSLSAQTPLRWSLEAASALVSSGNSPGGTIVSKGLGLKRPKAFAILPLMVQGKLVAIAYVDNGEATLSMSTVSKVFAVVDASLRNDITYVKELKATPESALANPTTAPVAKGSTGTFDTPAPNLAPVPIKTRAQYEPEPDDLDEIEAMIDEALANNPLVEQPLDQEPEEESSAVVSLHDHILNRDKETIAEPPPILKDPDPGEVRPLFTEKKTEPDPDPIDEFLTDVAEDEAVEPPAIETRAAIEPLPPKTINRRFRSEPRKSVAEKREERQARLREVISENEMFAEKEHDAPSLAPEWDETVAREVPAAFRSEAPPPPSLDGAPTEIFDIENRATAEHHVQATARIFIFPKRFLIAAGIAAILSAGTMGILAPPAGGPPAGFTFRIHPNSSLSQIAMHLERQGVIRNGLAFKALAKTRGMERGLRAGRYSIPQGAWAWDVLTELNRGQVRTRDVTIPEGLTLQETAEIIEASGLVTVEKFLRAARNSELIQAYGIQAPTAEGYLFPETYTFAEELSAEDIVKEMIDLFFTRFTQLADNREMGPTELMEYVTLASIIEREAKAPNEMSRIAGVFRNRLTRNMRLESCATVQYILGKPKERLLLSDLRKESPYNTYLKPGLPPGPISNPGLKALQASLNPEEHSYLFFLAKNDGSNEHVFTQTYAQHQKARLLQKQTGGGR